MTKTKFVFIPLMAFIFLSWPKVQASEFEELTYDDLVTQLSSKRERASAQKKVTPRTYLGFGMTNSYNQINTGGRNYNANLTGYELSTGMDLNSDKMRGEVAFRLSPESQSGTESAALKEFGGSLQYRRELNARWRAKFMGGLGFRFLNFSDKATRADVQETSSMLMGGAGLEARISQNIAIGGDASVRTPFFGTSTPDKNSLSFGLKLDTSFE